MNNANTTSTKRGLIARLRALVPAHPVTTGVAYRIVERQAALLRRELCVTTPELPEEAISGMPRVKVVEIDNLPSSGVSKGYQGGWIIVINALEPWQRQRFTIAHELGHYVANTRKSD